MIGIYAPEDPRVSFMHDLGMIDAPMVADAIEDGQFYGTVSAERAADLESDVFITYAETEDEMETYRDDPLLGQIPAIESGHAFAVVDKHVGLAVTNPSPALDPLRDRELRARRRAGDRRHADGRSWKRRPPGSPQPGGRGR